ncbi:MAG TPA: hypothetical protein VFY14_20240 [Streptomyces sp.]|nr:hypothetical protein [Streptomyces sp.]
MKRPSHLPPAVTFKSGAQLLIDLGMVDHITHQGVRHIAETHPDWPFGPDKEHPYWKLSNAVVMATDPFVAFFEDYYRRPKGES